MNIDVWEKPRNYIKLRVIVLINRSTRLLLKHKRHQHPKYVLPTVQWNQTNMCLWKICWENLVNKLSMHARRAKEGTRRTNILCRARVFHTYIVWCKLSQLDGCLRHLWYVYTNVRPVCDTVVWISEYSLMGKYSLVGCCTLILDGILDRIYLDMGDLYCL